MQYLNTHNDLILFAYNEPDVPNADDYHKVIDSDGELSREYKSIQKLKNYLFRLKVGPSEFVIKNILNYSKALSVNKSIVAGNISFLMN